MNIKYNEFGEVISVNGLATGQHIGTPLQDALGTPDENAPYYEECCTITNCGNTCDDNQPEHSGGVSSWNDLTDKPFYEEVAETFEPIVYNTNKDYTTVTTINSGAETFVYSKCADYIKLTDENFGSMTVYSADAAVTVVPASAAKLCVYEHGWECLEGTVLASDGQQKFSDIILPEGIWVRTVLEAGSSYIVIYPATTNIKTLEPKYLEFMELKDILPTQAVQLFEEGGLWSAAYGEGDPQVIAMNALQIGETYVVTWQGQEYICEAFDLAALIGGDDAGVQINKFCALGNASLCIPGGIDTGEPFYMHYSDVIDAYGHGRQVLIISKSGTVDYDKYGNFCFATMRVSRVGEGYKIKPEYLPTLTSPSGKKFRLTVDDSGTISAVEVTE